MNQTHGLSVRPGLSWRPVLIAFLALAPACGSDNGLTPNRPDVPGDSTSTNTITSHASAGAGANEPSGYQPFAVSDAGRMPAEHPSAGGILGEWYARHASAFTVVSSSNSPVSPSAVLQTRFRRGWHAGTGPADWGGWANGKTEKRKIYFSMWVKIVGPDYENQATGTKMGLFGYGPDGSHSGANQGILFLAGEGTQTIGSAFKLEFHQQFNAAVHPPFRNRELRQNVNRTRVMTCGEWHHWEVVMELNDLGRENGTFKWWVDGVRIMDYADMVYIFPGHARGFWHWKWNPIWGGRAGVKTRDDFIQIDQVYISGAS